MVEYPSYREQILTVLRELGIPPEVAEERGLVLYPEAHDLVLIETDADGREHYLESSAAIAWLKMHAVAQSEGVDFFVVSAFRSVKRQAEIIQRKLQRGLTLDQIMAVSALPGYSEHHTGCAVDIGTQGSPVLEVEFELTPSFDWLVQHAHQFGFVMSYPRGNAQGYSYEPWHWCYQHNVK